MALQTINIDDRTYDQLLDELKKHISVKDWTDHNPSDPGIMLLELFAWLGEMSLYKMNRVPETHERKFLKLVIDPPEPVTVPIELELSPRRNDDFVIPAGIRFATDFKDNKRYVFETFQESVIPKPTETGGQQVGTVLARSWKQIEGEILGVSDGSPNQTFTLKQTSVLIDFVNTGANYDPNPVIEVDGIEWKLKQFLLTEESRGNDKTHFMIDDFDNVVRFGDGEFGAIPPQGKDIVCNCYQVLEGPEALIKAGEIKHILDQIPVETGESITLAGNEDAEGGFNFFKKEERFTKGLKNYKKTYRLITAEDFENIVLTDFNELQEMTRNNAFNKLSAPYPASLLKVVRAIAFMNREPAGTGFEKQPGHVTLLILPEFKPNDAPPLVTQDMVNVDQSLEKKIDRFLDKRRLITTRLGIDSVRLKNFEINMHVFIKKEQNEIDMEKTIRQKIYDLLDIINGYFDKRGWPLGRNVYESEIYRLIEDIDGVDHVSALKLLPSSVNGDIEIKEHQLPALKSLNIGIERV